MQDYVLHFFGGRRIGASDIIVVSSGNVGRRDVVSLDGADLCSVCYCFDTKCLPQQLGSNGSGHYQRSSEPTGKPAASAVVCKATILYHCRIVGMARAWDVLYNLIWSSIRILVPYKHADGG